MRGDNAVPPRRAASLRRRVRSTQRIVYGIKAKGAAQYHYVGITKKSLEGRLADHRTFARGAISRRESSIFQDWLVLESSEKVIEQLAVVRRVSAYKAEAEWIRTLLSQGHPLLNTINAPDPPGKFRCRTPPCKKLTFSSRRSADRHGKYHVVEKCSLAAYPFAMDPDSPPDPEHKKRARRALYYKGVECDECREAILHRDLLDDGSRFLEDGTPYRVCTTCAINESGFESTDESGYNFVLAD